MTRLIGLLVLVLVGCGQTGGREVPFELRVETSGEATFTTTSGWTVELDEAALSLSAVYLWENPPALAARWNPLDLFVARAWAHPGDTHFSGGAVLGEHVGFVDYDALSSGLALGETVGNEGEVRSFSVLLSPPLSNEGPTRGHVAWVKGRAMKDEEIVAFEGGLDISDPRQRRVDGIATEGLLTTDAVFVLEVRVGRWLRDADFSRLTQQDDDGTNLITPDSQVRAAWFLGVRSSDAFSGRWE